LLPAEERWTGDLDAMVKRRVIRAGVKYICFMIGQSFANEPMTPLNEGLFAFEACSPGAT
jgi:hypothetical protein